MQSNFLSLLMAQIQNQDPLNPLDNSQVTTQLAQLNTVNGIEQLNSTLNQLLSSYNSTQAMQASDIIGKNVLVAGNNLPLSSGQAVGGATLGSAADAVTVTIKNSSGSVVQTENLGAKSAGNFYFSWNGQDANGNQLSDGNYTFSVNATASGKAVTATALQVGTVTAVTPGASGFQLDLGSMGSYNFSDVQQIL